MVTEAIRHLGQGRHLQLYLCANERNEWHSLFSNQEFHPEGEPKVKQLAMGAGESCVLTPA